MREPAEIEFELAEIAAIADDETRLNRIIVWCGAHPGEIPMAMHLLLGTATGSSKAAASDATPEAE